MDNHNIHKNHNPVRGNFGFGNPGGKQMQIPMQMPLNQNQQQVPQMLPQNQPQVRPYFPGHFQPSEPQAQAFAQGQTVQVHTQAQFMATQPQGHNNVSISSPSVSTPGSGGAGTGKRLHKPPSRPSGGLSAQGTASPMKTMELTPAAHRGKRKVLDKSIPDKVAAIVPESALYTQLVEFESRVDAALTRKKVEILEALKNHVRAQKILRVYLFNTYANQAQTDSVKENAESPSWTLRMIGRILEDGKDPALEGQVQKSSCSYPKFSTFFKKITIYLDQNLYPDNNVILWESSRSPVLHEGFEVKRKGDKEFTAIIRLEINYCPEKFKLSEALHEVLGIEVDTRPRIIAALWHYVKTRKLQIPGDTSSFMCDLPLRKVFGEDKLKFSMVMQKITPHLIPPGPIHIEHKIKLSGGSPAGNTCYDVLVDIPWTLEREMSNFLANIEKNKEIENCDEAISSAIKKIHEHRRRRAFFLGFSQSPGEFINSLIASQARDLKLASLDTNRDVEKERQAEFYHQPWIEDAVIRYLNRKTAAGSEAPGSK
ncbi:SWI/SNF complex component SNF12 homolog [Primulina tabacum]|uniref:SWI/SNF complex component SNF12 homolog n=1 Tax=Primulina tabacum TaxID=48773 RepID=UPI003F59D2F8